MLAALVGVVPRLIVAARQYIEYDGWWHIFIAQQDVWSSFVWEYKNSAHPPLFLLLLKAAMLFGKSRLVYRSVSIVAGILTVYVLGRFVSRLTRNRAVAPIMALGLSLSWNAIVVSCEVRSYALCVLFLAIAGQAFFELSTPRVRSAPGHSLVFCVASALALLSHYSAGLFLVAAGVVLAGRFVLVRGFRRRVVVVLGKVPVRVVLPVAIPLATAAFLYLTHARSHLDAMNHLPEFYLATSTAGGPLGFLLRNTALLVGFVLPFRLDVASLGTQVVVCLAALLVVLGVILLPRPRGQRAVHRLAGGLVLALVVLAMALGLRGAYPYGGAMRHQFYLLPFVLVLLATGLDVALSWIRVRAVRAVLLLVIVVGLVGGFVAGARSFFWSSDELYKKEMSTFWRAFPDPTAVYLDQYSLVAFFAHYHDWTWHLSGGVPENGWILRYTLSKDGRTLAVLRDRTRWSVDLSAGRAGQDLRGCLKAVAPRPLTVFSLRQFPGKDDKGSLAAGESRARAGEALARSGVLIERVEAGSSFAFVELQLAPRAASAR